MAFEINSTGLTDPTAWLSDGIAELDIFTDGAPLLQGLESGTLTWAAMTQTAYAALYDAWEANQGSRVGGKLPDEDGAALGTYRSVTAYFHQPKGEARGGVRVNVTMRVSFIS